MPYSVAQGRIGGVTPIKVTDGPRCTGCKLHNTRPRRVSLHRPDRGSGKVVRTRLDTYYENEGRGGGERQYLLLVKGAGVSDVLSQTIQ